MEKKVFKLGSRVKDSTTGFCGSATARCCNPDALFF